MEGSLEVAVLQVLQAPSQDSQPPLSRRKRSASWLGEAAEAGVLSSKRRRQEEVVVNGQQDVGLAGGMPADPGRELQAVQHSQAEETEAEQLPSSPASVLQLKRTGDSRATERLGSKVPAHAPSLAAWAIPAAEPEACGGTARAQPTRQWASVPPARATPPPCGLQLEDVCMEVPDEQLHDDLNDEEWTPRFQGAIMQPEEGVIGGYRLLHEKAVGDGGLGVVVQAEHAASGALVALKLGRNEFDEQLGNSDFTWWTFETEWNCYRALGLGQAHNWMPKAYQAGLYRTKKGVVPWISMELLGPSLHWLMLHQNAIGPANLGAYAHGMLSALENLHRAGFVHRDVKPANFVTQYGFDGASGELPKVILLDFGFAQRWSPAKSQGRLDFCGTPDFASIQSLLGRYPGPADDVEAMAYSLLQLYMQEMPWDITKPLETNEARLARENAALVLEGRTRHGGQQPQQAEAPSSSAGGWTEEQLRVMAHRKEQLWNSMILRGEVPQFIVQIINYCKSLAPGAMPHYAYLHEIIDRTYAMGPYAAPAPKPFTAAAGPCAALLAAEE